MFSSSRLVPVIWTWLYQINAHTITAVATSAAAAAAASIRTVCVFGAQSLRVLISVSRCLFTCSYRTRIITNHQPESQEITISQHFAIEALVLFYCAIELPSEKWMCNRCLNLIFIREHFNAHEWIANATKWNVRKSVSEKRVKTERSMCSKWSTKANLKMMKLIAFKMNSSAWKVHRTVCSRCSLDKVP